MDAYEVGQEVKVEIFSAGEIVDVTGVSKGKGFQGAIKRHGQSRGLCLTVHATTVVLVQWDL